MVELNTLDAMMTFMGYATCQNLITFNKDPRSENIRVEVIKPQIKSASKCMWLDRKKLGYQVWLGLSTVRNDNWLVFFLLYCEYASDILETMFLV